MDWNSIKKKKAPTQTLTPRRRDLMLKCVDDDARCVPIMHFMDNLVRCDQALQWLISNKMTGVNLHGFLHVKFKRSMGQMSAFILKEVNRDLEAKPLIYGKDVIG